MVFIEETPPPRPSPLKGEGANKAFLNNGLVFLFAFFLSCIPKPQIMDGSQTPVVLDNLVIDRDTTWQGMIRIKGTVEVKKDAVLTLKPGTVVSFAWMDNDKDGIGDSELIVKGQLIAVGSPEQLVIFTSTTRAVANGWKEIRLEQAQGGEFKYCYFTFANWALHVHFTPVSVDYCRFEFNEGGMRFNSNLMYIRHNLIQNNRIGLRFLQCDPVIEGNTIKDNLTGIFIRLGVKKPIITQNNIYQNENYNLKIGEEQAADIACPNNYWGTTSQEIIEAKIYDKKDSGYLGRVKYQPFIGVPLGTAWSP
ncbi:MAG: right-handed parallel beta-helix repeat-containing protein [Candidatus Schekmanbacteria bacterium]|nr:right-handed parallel beta-helix repeat-containing protein [Candidatus Schekmanbacteria bacterium]